MRIIATLLSVTCIIDSVTCVKNELSAVTEEVVHRHRTLSEKNRRRDSHRIAQRQHPPTLLQWNDPQLLRQLQDSEDSSGACLAADSVNFQSDDFNMAVFGEDTFGASCNCSESNNVNEVFAALSQLNPADGVRSYVDQANAIIGTLYTMSQYQCINQCETCLNGVCAVLETSALSSTSSNTGNFSFSELVSRNFDILSSVTNATFMFSNCVTFTENGGGKICFIIDFDTVSIPFADTPCTIEYNGMACNSCVIPEADFLTSDNCFMADCTNIDVSAMLNSCNDTGFVGPFVYLNLLETTNVTNSTFTVGSCDGEIAPVAPSDPATAPTPVSVPMDTPVIASTTEPSVQPIASAPTPITTASPITSPAAAPVRTPVAAPVPSRPAPIATSGSFASRVLGGHMLFFLLGMILWAAF